MAPERGEAGGPQEEGVALGTGQSPVTYPKEGDGGVVVRRGEDDDLTSLSWLQDKNLLKGINLRSNGAGGKEESPTSDYAEECPSEQGESTCSSVTSSSPLPLPVKNRHPHHIPYDPKIHVTSKPPYSFSCLIFMSIEDSKGKALPVKEIYTWILDHFPYYRNAPTGWKNSVRHNLSLNKCFRKVDKAPNLGKGSLWMVDPVFRPNLVQALMKAPYHPYTNIERTISSLRFTNRTSESSASSEEELLDEEDAAAAMLALKHGPHVVRHAGYRKRQKASLYRDGRHSDGYLYRKDEVGGMSQDHTYSTLDSLLDQDEAFMEGSDSNSTCSLQILEEETEERRKTVEGADALLNLAGIKTSGLMGGLKRRISAVGAVSKRRAVLQHRIKAKR